MESEMDNLINMAKEETNKHKQSRIDNQDIESVMTESKEQKIAGRQERCSNYKTHEER